MTLRPRDFWVALIGAQAETFDGASNVAAGFIAWSEIVGFDEDGIELDVAAGHFKARGQAVEKAFEDGVAIHADDAVVRTGHAHIRDVSGAFWKDVLVRGGHVGVGADDGSDAAIQVPAEG